MHRVAIHTYPLFLNVLKTATEKDFILQSHPDTYIYCFMYRVGPEKIKNKTIRSSDNVFECKRKMYFEPERLCDKVLYKVEVDQCNPKISQYSLHRLPRSHSKSFRKLMFQIIVLYTLRKKIIVYAYSS